MKELPAEKIRESVRKRYGEIATQGQSGCGCAPSGCCSGPAPTTPDISSLQIGYSQEELQAVPVGADLGLGCGNPQAIAALQPGETVLDLGSGGGFDCFLAARQVGPGGRVIGVDMTAEMMARARKNASEAGYANVEFRLGEIEHLPVADASVDVIISNCVINLSPDKGQVLREAFRVLRPGGRLAISDIVALATMPEEMRNDLALYVGCIAGAATLNDLEALLCEAGFDQIRIQPKDESRRLIQDWAPGRKIEDYIASASIEAVKPAV
ncbi:MAG: arsenite methyltransferase [Deltaproteobacteria bacterium]|nr:arsenite methyltransferase [Deltaproteobacteria bacterium]